MTPKTLLAGILVIAVVAAWARLILWRRAAGPDAPVRTWRLAALLVLQPICAALLFLGLFPPSLPVAGDVLVIATANAPRNTLAHGRLVAMPEATGLAGVERAPDLGTALRRYPDARRIKVLGDGLTARDRDAARGVAVEFETAAPRPGLVSLQAPGRVAPGMRFEAGGQVARSPDAVVELLDPAGRVTDTRKVDAEGRFVVTGTARAAGLVAFTLRVRDGRGRVLEQADLPVWVEAGAAPRLLILAGAPGPEVKYLRRWATDAGFVVTTQMSAGGGIQLGDPPIALTAATLRGFDVAVIDERGWAGMGGTRETVLGAVRDGLGLVLRASGPLDGASRAQWRAAGFTMTGSGGLAPIRLPAPTDAAIARTRSGIGSVDTPADLEVGDERPPELSRLALTPVGGDAVPLIQDAGGATLSAWRATGLGRVAVFTGLDSYGLTLTGRRGLYGDWWSGMLSTVARPATGAAAAFAGPAWAGDRVALCGLSGDARVEGPGGAITALTVDPATPGCAGFWPERAGWHGLRKAGADAWPFYVQPAERLAGVRAARDREATAMLRNTAVSRASGATQTQPGPSWPWLLAWLAFSAGLWWLERSNLGRIAKARTAAA